MSGANEGTIDPTSEIGFWKWLDDLTWNEVHLMVLGLYAGFVAIRPRPRHQPVGRLNWEHNEWYWKGMYVAGYVLKALILGAVGAAQLPELLQSIQMAV